MTPRRHPTENMLEAYAAGDLPTGPAIVVRAHLDMCGRCRQVSADVEAAEGRLLAALPDIELSHLALQQALRRLDEPPPHVEPGARDVRGLALLDGVPLPSMLRHLGLEAPRYADDQSWVAHLDAPRWGGWRTFILHAGAKGVFPSHGHAGDEFVQVVAGSFFDGTLEQATGDFSTVSSGQDHSLTVTSDGPCICLVSSERSTRWQAADQPIGDLLDI